MLWPCCLLVALCLWFAFAVETVIQLLQVNQWGCPHLREQSEHVVSSCQAARSGGSNDIETVVLRYVSYF